MDKYQNTSKLGNIGKVLMCKRVMKHQTSENGEIPFYKISTFGGKIRVKLVMSSIAK